MTEACVDKAHELGLIVHAYTFTDGPSQYTDPYKWGVDGVFANHPDIAVAERDEMFPVPEPASLALFGAALTGFAVARPRRSPARAA